MIRWNRVLTVGAIAGALSGMFIFAEQLWSAADGAGIRPIIKREFDADNVLDTQVVDSLRDKVAGLASSVLLIRFQLLYQRRLQNGSLSFAEQQELCALARELQFHGVPGC